MNMKQLTAEQKHSILTHLQSRGKGVSADAIAAAHGVKGGRSRLHKWLQRWDGTSQSLERKPSSGRPRALTRAQVKRHIKPRILAANRRGEAIHYTTIHSAVQQATGSQVSIQTLRRYGKQELGVKQKRSTKRTASESQSASTYADGKCVAVWL